ncbi:unnamed protein product [Trichogramma brassicae]|uniref:G protein gamma domain-containing protein n=2 Tax=Trichogramma TaxID=7490 RepID=A0A6H5ITD9_9HYME|nr:guanine nucleotide-binding protein subunit gamma-1-like [Trichogramma pretiosum]CAB0040842.1 unnamed protein product [Trichogramma brassicae]
MVMSTVQTRRQEVEQLRREATIKREKLSKSMKEMLDFIREHEQEDCLLVGFSSQKSNPFREKNSCAIL